MHSYDRIARGKRLRALRKSKGLSARALAEQANCSERWLCELERGKHDMTLRTFLNLCATLNCLPSDILGQENPPTPTNTKGNL